MHNRKSQIVPGPLSQEVRMAILEGRTSQEQICIQLEISIAYFRSLVNGHREWGSMSTDKLYVLADLLGLERRQIWVLAGILPADSLVEEDPDSQLNSSWAAMQRDRFVGPLLTDGQAEWLSLPRPARIRELAMWSEILSLRAKLAGALASDRVPNLEAPQQSIVAAND